jgi:taurine transport system permease protein
VKDGNRPDNRRLLYSCGKLAEYRGLYYMDQGRNRMWERRSSTIPFVISVSSVLVVFFIWTISSEFKWVNPLFIPSPRAVWFAFIEIVREGYKGNPLLHHIFTSLYRMLIALLLALITAVPLGIISGYSKYARAALDPFIEFYRPLPPLAYYTLLVLWLGIGDASKIALLYLAAFAPLYLSAALGVQRVPRDRINGSLSLGASRFQVFVHVIFPSCLPELFTGMRTAIGFTYTTLVAAEMVASVSGMGWMVLDASKFLRSDVIFVGIFLMGGIAMLIDAVIRWIQRRRLPWINT